jgi:hypothetical protein
VRIGSGLGLAGCTRARGVTAGSQTKGVDCGAQGRRTRVQPSAVYTHVVLSLSCVVPMLSVDSGVSSCCTESSLSQNTPVQ